MTILAVPFMDFIKQYAAKNGLKFFKLKDFNAAIIHYQQNN
jgi:hypothetical protein